MAACRSTCDLTQHLSGRLNAEHQMSPSASESRLEAMNNELLRVGGEFQQLELLARTKEVKLRENR